MNSTSRQLGSDQYFKKFIIWYLVLASSFPFIELTGQFARFSEANLECIDSDLLNKVFLYLFFAFFLVVGLFTMENARRHSIERKKEIPFSFQYSVFRIIKLSVPMMVAAGVTMFISRVSIFEMYPALTVYIYRICNG